MKFVTVTISNHNDILEADVSASADGQKPSGASYHLVLGDAPRGDENLTVAEALRLAGWAIADQLKTGDRFVQLVKLSGRWR